MDQRFVSPSPHQQNSCVEAPWYLEMESFCKNIYLIISCVRSWLWHVRSFVAAHRLSSCGVWA